MRINKTLTKNYILDNIEEIDIFSEYLNIDDRDIERCISDNLLMCNPLRADDNPTVGFRFSNKGRLKMRDFSGFFWGDCFDLVAYIYTLNVNSKEDFYKILYDIAIRFGLIKDSAYKEQTIAISKKRIKNLRESVKRKINIKVRDWNVRDKSYWKAIIKNDSHTIQYLKYFNVFAVENYWIDIDSQPAPKYYYKSSDPCYAYYFGKDENGIDDIKLYFPLRDKHSRFPKFITNASVIGGMQFLPNNMDFLLITKSYKDVISLYSFITPINPTVGIITLSSESTPIDLITYTALASKVTKYFRGGKYKAIFTLLDFDPTGIKMSNKMHVDFNTMPFFLNGQFGSVTYEGKDFTDVITKNDKSFAETLINSTLVNFKQLTQ